MAGLHRKTLCYSLVCKYAEVFNLLATSLPKISNCAYAGLIPRYIQQRQNFNPYSMISHAIDASLTTKSLTFRPGGPPATFGIVVINRSEQFAAFELKILAAAFSGDSSWYRLSPEVSAAKPPGDRTDFQVEILESPIPHFVGTVNLTIKISSPQLATERRLVLPLTLEAGDRQPLVSVDLPIRRSQVYPCNVVDIPVRVQNLGLRPAEIILHLKDLEPTWVIGTTERRLRLETGRHEEITFQCQPPKASHAPSQDYLFTVTARNKEGATASAEGILEVLPVGFVQFEAQPSQQRIPAQGSWLPDCSSDTATFQLRFKNASNLLQRVAIEMQGKDCQMCQSTVNPVDANLPLGEETPVALSIKTKRPWIGRVKLLQFEVKAWLSDQRLGNTDPATQPLTLKVSPIVPAWLILALLALLSALLAILLQQPPVSHLAAVNAVRFNGSSGLLPLVLSGSDDCTIRSWTIAQKPFVGKETLRPQSSLAEGSLQAACSNRKLRSSQGLLAVVGQAVRTLELIPVNNSSVFAGLQNGEIQAWDVNTGKKQYVLKDQQDKTGDFALSLAFTEDASRLYSGYGSGTIREWQIPPSAQSRWNPNRLILPNRFQFQVWALALSPDRKMLVSAGQFKRLMLWNFAAAKKPVATQILLSSEFGNQGQNDFFWSIAFAGRSHLLATADSDGYITLWNLDKCQEIKPNNNVEDSSSQLPQTRCEISDRWRASQANIRSIRFTPDGQRLVSAGDDGQIIAWTLVGNKQDETKKVIVDTVSSKIINIDLATNERRTLIASGAEDSQVRLHLLK